MSEMDEGIEAGGGGASAAPSSPPSEQAAAPGENHSPGSERRTPHAARTYRVSLDLFEGPLDLLLHLIKKNEIDVADIPIAVITEQYLGYIDLMHELNLDVAGEYLVMAATLTLIKSRLLLPSAEGEEDEEPDPRADLVRQILEYQRFREAAQRLAERPLLHRDVFVREPGADGIDPSAGGPPALKATTWQLLEALRNVLKRARPDPVHEVGTEPVSLRDRMEALLHTLSVTRSIEFDALFEEGATRLTVIVTFLALLELIKMGAVEALQHEHFGDIRVVLLVEDVSQVSLELEDNYGAPSPADAHDAAAADGDPSNVPVEVV